MLRLLRKSPARNEPGISKLVPVKALDTTLLIGGTQDEPVVMEYTPQLPGQRNFAGGEQEEPKMIRLADAKQA